MERRRYRTPEIGVQLPGGPLLGKPQLTEDVPCDKLQTRIGSRGRNGRAAGRRGRPVCGAGAATLQPLSRKRLDPGGETDDHVSVLTRRSGFDSWPGYCDEFGISVTVAPVFWEHVAAVRLCHPELVPMWLELSKAPVS